MQRGVDLSDLDVSYVSSLALYFLLMFGLNDVYSIILGEGSEMDEQRMMQMQVIIECQPVLFIYLFIYLFVYLFIYLFIFLFIRLFIYLFTY